MHCQCAPAVSSLWRCETSGSQRFPRCLGSGSVGPVLPCLEACVPSRCPCDSGTLECCLDDPPLAQEVSWRLMGQLGATWVPVALAGDGVVGAWEEIEKADRSGEEVGSGAPGGGQGEGLERGCPALSAQLQAPSGTAACPPRTHPRVCPLAHFTLHRYSAGCSPTKMPPSHGGGSYPVSSRQSWVTWTGDLAAPGPGTSCGPSQTLPCVPSSTGRVRARPGLIQVCPSVSQPHPRDLQGRA